jgi:predicted amidohydrolase YtcJ
MKTKTLLSFALAAVTLNVAAQTRDSADVIYLNGDIFTGAVLPYMPGAKPPSPVRTQALAVKNGRILAIGSNDEVRKLHTGKTKTIDLGGHFVMPGINDAHVHLGEAGREKLNVDLVGTKSLQEMVSRISARAKTLAPGEWIIGGGWDHTKWEEQKLPSRTDLDSVTGDHPAYFDRVDGHIAVVNSAALRAAGITRSSMAPAGGAIDRDANGEATGIFRESAKDLITAKIPKPNATQRRRALTLAVSDAASHGLTSVQDYSDWEDFLVLEEMERSNNLPIRVSEWLSFSDPIATLQEHRARHSRTDAMLHIGMLKGFMDGSLGSRTAVLLAPYADDAKNTGLPQYKQSDLDQMTRERAKAGFQIGFHAIGDGAAAMALEAFAEGEREVRETNAKQHDFRFRIEHDQVLTSDQPAAYARLGVIASVQPNHLLTDMNWAQDRIGPERAQHSYPWADFVKNKVMLAFGTDYPVEPVTPFRGIYAAITRQNEAGTKSYYPEQKLTIEQAIAAYTSGSAYADFAEKEKGLLQPGMLADFVVLDRDLTKVSPHDILDTHVLRTVVGGKTVYDGTVGR